MALGTIATRLRSTVVGLGAMLSTPAWFARTFVGGEIAFEHTLAPIGTRMLVETNVGLLHFTEAGRESNWTEALEGWLVLW